MLVLIEVYYNIGGLEVHASIAELNKYSTTNSLLAAKLDVSSLKFL